MRMQTGDSWLDPAGHAEKRTVSPQITIESVSADDRFYAPDAHLPFPAHTSSVQVSCTAVSLSDPEAIGFPTSCRKRTRTDMKRRRQRPLLIATFLPVSIISALWRPIRTASGPAHPQTWLSQ
jgi:hypothetical protein